jgi:cysteine desulfurase
MACNWCEARAVSRERTMLHLPVYLDNNSTTRVDPRVVDVMLPWFSEHYGNASSRHHSFGWKADEAVVIARGQVAKLIGADPREIVFTSGATESDNLAFKGVSAIYRQRGDHIVSVATEHKAVLDVCKRLQRDGLRVTLLPVDRFGQVAVDDVAAAVTSQTILVSVMAANNEIGTLQPIADIGKLCKARGVLFHTDAVQAAGKVPLDVQAMGIDLMSLSAHKMYGPKGVGALFVRRRDPHVRIEPLLDGGGHERGMRSGTLNVPGIVGFGKACELAGAAMPDEAAQTRALRELLRQGLMERLDGVTLNGHPTQRLPGNLNVSFAGVQGEALMVSMRQIAVSSGSACTSANPEPSYVLKALGVDDELAHASIRFGIGRFNTPEEIDFALEEVIRNVKRLRTFNSVFQGETVQCPLP